MRIIRIVGAIVTGMLSWHLYLACTGQTSVEYRGNKFRGGLLQTEDGRAWAGDPDSFTLFRPYLAHFFPVFFRFFARFHRLDEAVPTSRKPQPRAKKQWGPNTVLPVGLTPEDGRAWAEWKQQTHLLELGGESPYHRGWSVTKSLLLPKKRIFRAKKVVFPAGERTWRGCLGLRTCCWRCSRACASPGTPGRAATTARSCCDQWNRSLKAPRGGRARA